MAYNHLFSVFSDIIYLTEPKEPTIYYFLSTCFLTAYQPKLSLNFKFSTGFVKKKFIDLNELCYLL